MIYVAQGFSMVIDRAVPPFVPKPGSPMYTQVADHLAI
jgi:hypothetical protein